MECQCWSYTTRSTTYQTLDILELTAHVEAAFAGHAPANVLNQGAHGVLRRLAEELASKIHKRKVGQKHAKR